jgi:hypothetical protein
MAADSTVFLGEKNVHFVEDGDANDVSVFFLGWIGFKWQPIPPHPFPAVRIGVRVLRFRRRVHGDDQGALQHEVIAQILTERLQQDVGVTQP